MASDMNIHQRMLAIRSEVGALHKGGHNQHEGFAFVQGGDVVNAVRGLMDKHGVLLTTSIDQATEQPHDTKAGTAWHFTQLWTVCEFINVDSPDDRITVKWYGQGQDSGERGVGKALTYGEKYLLLKQFNIATDAEDDPDSHQQPEMASRPAQSRPSGGSGGGGWEPSDPQLGRFWRIARLYNWKEEDVKKLLEEKGLTSTKQLSHEQYDALCGEGNDGNGGYFQGNPVGLPPADDGTGPKARAARDNGEQSLDDSDIPF